MTVDSIQTELAAKLAANATTAAFLPGMIFCFRGCKKTTGEALATDEAGQSRMAWR